MLLLSALTHLSAPSLDVLFLGNSHTSVNSVPSMVESLVKSGGAGHTIKVTMKTGGNLESLAKDPSLPGFISRGRFTDVVLQGAALSSSHKYKYSQEGAVKLAKAAKQAGSRVWLFAEWPRKGWDETPYILGIYGGISKSSGAKIIPICSVFDHLLKQNSSLDVWSGDGNHASLLGSYIGAVTIAQALAPGAKPAWRPDGIAAPLLASISASVKTAGKPYLAK